MRSILLASVLAFSGCEAALKARIRAEAATELKCPESQLELQWQRCPHTPSIVCRQTVSGCGGVAVFDSNTPPVMLQ